MLEPPSKQRLRKLRTYLERITLFFLILGIVAYQSEKSRISRQEDIEQPQDRGSEVFLQEQSTVKVYEVILDEQTSGKDTSLSMANESKPQETSDNMDYQDDPQEIAPLELQDNVENDNMELCTYRVSIPKNVNCKLYSPARNINILIAKKVTDVKSLKLDEKVDLDSHDVNYDEKGISDLETQPEEEVEETSQQEEPIPAEPEEYPSSDMAATDYTLGDIAKIVQRMNDTEGMKAKFTWNEEKFTEDSLFIDYIRDLMDRWYEEGKITRKWEPDEERFTSTTPYYTEEQGDYITLANLMYAEEGVLFRKCTFEEAVLAHLFAGTVAMNLASDSKGRFGANLNEVIFTGHAYPKTTRNRVKNQECKREIIYVLAKIIIQYGPIGPESMIFQSQSAQGIAFARIYNQKFDLEKGT